MYKSQLYTHRPVPGTQGMLGKYMTNQKIILKSWTRLLPLLKSQEKSKLSDWQSRTSPPQPLPMATLSAPVPSGQGSAPLVHRCSPPRPLTGRGPPGQWAEVVALGLSQPGGEACLLGPGGGVPGRGLLPPGKGPGAHRAQTQQRACGARGRTGLCALPPETKPESTTLVTPAGTFGGCCRYAAPDRWGQEAGEGLADCRVALTRGDHKGGCRPGGCAGIPPAAR